MLSRFIVALLLFCAVQKLYAQETIIGLNFLAAQPQNEFKENVDNWGFGIGGMLAHRPDSSPFIFGAELNFAIYGHESRREPFSSTIPDVTVAAETNNSFLLFQPLLRIQSPTGVFRPYVDGFVGLNYLFTETRIRDENLIIGPAVASSFNEHDIAFNYGLGGGIMLRVHQAQQEFGEHSKLKEVLLDFRVRYSFGGNATYLKRGAITRENGTVSIDPLQSRTDLVTYQLGVAFTF